MRGSVAQVAQAAANRAAAGSERNPGTVAAGPGHTDDQDGRNDRSRQQRAARVPACGTSPWDTGDETYDPEALWRSMTAAWNRANVSGSHRERDAIYRAMEALRESSTGSGNPARSRSAAGKGGGKGGGKGDGKKGSERSHGRRGK